MKILWFEVTEPSAYVLDKPPIGGWQDSLERIVRTVPEIELTIAFVSEESSEVKVIDGVTYVPIKVEWTRKERIFGKHWDLYVKKVIPEAKRIVEAYKPSLIQVFGTEWPLGQIAAYTDVPVVIHIMGAIVPYNNANYPPGYSFMDSFARNCCHPKKLLGLWMSERDSKNWEEWERKTWKLVKYYMGRTQWDCSLSNVMHPGRKYFHVEEALRTDFFIGEDKWKLPHEGEKLKLISTGCSSYWKGPDMLLKVANILKCLDVNFEWKVAGNMNPSIMRDVENHEGVSFEDCNVDIIGFKKPSELMGILCNSTIYVHTAYIENSPNSICEAQCLGLPVVSTNVGGIASLVRNDADGILVAANDPWQMVDAILRLWKDKELMKSMSERSSAFALKRHNDENIKQQLLFCYNSILGIN